MTWKAISWITAGMLLGAGLSSWVSLRAQNERGNHPGGPATAPAAAPGDVREALERPYHFPFEKPTSLEKVRDRLSRDLNITVVLDRAALDRKGVEPDDEVELAMSGVRLRTGLKLLLDQLGLSFKAAPEDRMLIITDAEGAEDPLERIWNELRALHRDLHDLQDSVDELLDDRAGAEDGRTPLRKPTIIDEEPHDSKPAEKADRQADSPRSTPGAPRSAPRAGPGGTPPASSPGNRIPLSHRRRRGLVYFKGA